MKLLFVDCCISQRGDESRTRALCDAFLDAYRRTHPAVEVETVDLERLNPKPFNQIMLDDRDALAAVKAFDAPVFKLARQFKTADHIVVGAPFWDLSFPSLLRIYIEYISANGVTYAYDGRGSRGTCMASRLAFLTTGGDLEREDSLGVLYWRQLCAMYGILKFDYVFAGGLDLDPARAPEIMAASCDLARKLAKEF